MTSYNSASCICTVLRTPGIALHNAKWSNCNWSAPLTLRMDNHYGKCYWTSLFIQVWLIWSWIHEHDWLSQLERPMALVLSDPRNKENKLPVAVVFNRFVRQSKRWRFQRPIQCSGIVEKRKDLWPQQVAHSANAFRFGNRTLQNTAIDQQPNPSLLLY